MLECAVAKTGFLNQWKNQHWMESMTDLVAILELRKIERRKGARTLAVDDSTVSSEAVKR
jgi:hypothetical protein